MSDDLDQAIDRISYAIKNEPSRKISFLFGAGLSLPSVPGTSEMIAQLCDATGAYSNALRERTSTLDLGAGYRTAAHELRQRRGESGLARAIRTAVGSAYSSRHPLIEGHEGEALDHEWLLPDAQTGLARLIALIPPQQRGPLFTTNFDPLTEVALRIRGVQPATISAPSGVAIPIDAVYGALPVVHLHGFWLQGATLSTGDQLTRPRPQIEEMLQRQLSQSIMVVAGYAGWEDSFTRALQKVIEDGRWAMMSGELLWMNYSRDISSPLLRSITGAPGVSIYRGIDAQLLFDGVHNELANFHRSSRDSYAGWSSGPVRNEVGSASAAAIAAFTEGVQPDWAVAAALPRLESTALAVAELDQILVRPYDAIVALSGPTGEGKTLGLLQIALEFGSREEPPVVVVRQPTAPAIDANWIAHLRKRPLTLLVIDEADLILQEVFASYSPRNESDGVIVIVMALHSRFEQTLRNQATLAMLPVQVVPFDGFTNNDAINIASAWKRADILPDDYRDTDVSTVAEMIVDSGDSVNGSSLFGAVLHLWMGEDLEDRISHLLARLERPSIRGRSLRQLLCAVAVTQHAWDVAGEYSVGITLDVLGDVCGLHSRDVVPLVIAPLGREVGLAQIGDYVYVRHPSIAEGIVEAIGDTSEMLQVVSMVSEAGAHLRNAGNVPRSAWHSAYRLFERLDGEAALGAAFGAINGSPGRLEPRVSYLSVLRKAGRISTAEAYSSRLLAGVSDYSDYRRNVRGLYVERAFIDLSANRHASAVGYACASLSDLDATPMTVDQLRYGLVASARASHALSAQDRSVRNLNLATLDLLVRVPGATEVYAPLRNHQLSSPSVVEAVSRFRRSSADLGGKLLPAGSWRFTGLLDAIARQGG